MTIDAPHPIDFRRAATARRSSVARYDRAYRPPASLGEENLFDDDARRRAAWGLGAGHFVPNPGCHLAEDEGVRVVGVGDGDRGAAVGGLADLDVERPLAE